MVIILLESKQIQRACLQEALECYEVARGTAAQDTYVLRTGTRTCHRSRMSAWGFDASCRNPRIKSLPLCPLKICVRLVYRLRVGPEAAGAISLERELSTFTEIEGSSLRRFQNLNRPKIW